MTLTASPAYEPSCRTAVPRSRTVGILSIATGVASVILLAIHPADDAKTFAEMLRSEAANRLVDGIVHGGFIAVLSLQLVCYSVFSARLGPARPASIAALVFLSAGAIFLSGSMVLDGLVTPAVAARYLAAPAKLEYARTLFVLLGSLIGVLMPIGLMFLSAAIAAWGWTLSERGMSRAAGVLGMIAGGLLLVILGASFTAMNPFVLMGAIVANAIWATVTGVMLMQTNF